MAVSGSDFADRSDLTGPFDVIGDVHGCLATLRTLLDKLGHTDGMPHPHGRLPVFVGDVCGRGLSSWQALAFVRRLVKEGAALMVRGNHEDRLAGRIRAEPVPDEGALALACWLEGLPLQLMLDGGRLLVVHAAMRADLIGVGGPEAEWYALGGARTKDRHGRTHVPDWQAAYTGEPFVAVGHTPVARPRFSEHGGGSVILDTGAVYGERARDRITGRPFSGHLSALRWPEREIVSVPTEAPDAA